MVGKKAVVADVEGANCGAPPPSPMLGSTEVSRATTTPLTAAPPNAATM